MLLQLYYNSSNDLFNECAIHYAPNSALHPSPQYYTPPTRIKFFPYNTKEMPKRITSKPKHALLRPVYFSSSKSPDPETVRNNLRNPPRTVRPPLRLYTKIPAPAIKINRTIQPIPMGD